MKTNLPSHVTTVPKAACKKSLTSFAAVLTILIMSGCAAKKIDLLPTLGVRTMTAKGTIDLNNGALKGRLQLAAKEPSFLRLEVPGPFGQTLGVFIANKDSIFFTAPPDNNQQFLWEKSFMPFALESSDLTKLLLGYPPEGFQGDYNFTLDDKNRIITLERVNSSGVVKFKASLSDYKNVSAINIAHKIIIESPAGTGGASVITIKLKSVKANIALDDNFFDIPKK